MGWLRDQLEGFLQWAFGWVADGLQALLSRILRTLIGPIVGTPGPTGTKGWIAFGRPANHPWTALYDQVYLPFVLPLSVGLLFVALAYVGLRTGAIDARQRQRLLRRVGIAFGAVFFWLPIASAGTQLFDAIGLAIATGGNGTGQLVSDLGTALEVGTGGVVLVLVLYAVESVLILFAALVFAARWLAIIVLTIAMPLLAALWVFEVWPLKRFAGIARRVAGVYPGLLIAGLPSALLLRIAVVAEFEFGFGGLFQVLIGGVLIPTAAVASLATIRWSHSGIDRFARQAGGLSATTAAQTPQAARRTKQRVGQSVRGARNVHRGFAGRGAVRSDGTAAFGSDGSRAHKAGQAGKRAARRARTGPRWIAETGTSKATEYAQARRSESDSVTGQAKHDVATSARTAGGRARDAVQYTKEKLSRW